MKYIISLYKEQKEMQLWFMLFQEFIIQNEKPVMKGKTQLL